MNEKTNTNSKERIKDSTPKTDFNYRNGAQTPTYERPSPPPPPKSQKE